MDIEAAQHLYKRLQTLLADDDSDAIELFKESAPALKVLLGPLFADIKHALDSYDFVNALALLRTAHLPTDQDKEDSAHE